MAVLMSWLRSNIPAQAVHKQQLPVLILPTKIKNYTDCSPCYPCIV
jgi:hypothetical protein